MFYYVVWKAPIHRGNTQLLVCSTKAQQTEMLEIIKQKKYKLIRKGSMKTSMQVSIK